MVGYVSDIIAAALRAWEPLRNANVVPVRATDGVSVVVDTPIPAIAVHISGDDGYGNTYLGGGIRLYFEAQLHYICPITNYTFSPDKGKQAEMMDLSDEIIRCMELSNVMDYVKQKYDMSLQFDRLDTYSTYATKNAISVAVEVHNVVYKGSVEFNTNIDKDKYLIELKRIEIDNNGINKSIIE